jgi:hypothetical protein
MSTGNNGAFSKISDAFLTFFVKIMSFAGLFMFDFPGRRHFEAFFGATVSFYFRHIYNIFNFAEKLGRNK